jgi:hypothetical protein
MEVGPRPEWSLINAEWKCLWSGRMSKGARMTVPVIADADI